MTTGAAVRLIPMFCVQCAQPVEARPGEVAWVCASCGKGMILGADGQLKAQPVFFSPEIRPGASGRPFWVTMGRVEITGRDTYSGNSARESAEFWQKERLFFIPAYAASLEEQVSLGMQMLASPVTIASPGPQAPFLPVVTGVEDIRPLAEFIVLATEADRRDALKTLRFNVSLQNPQLWVLP